jgi:hypothetical protein
VVCCEPLLEMGLCFIYILRTVVFFECRAHQTGWRAIGTIATGGIVFRHRTKGKSFAVQ